MTNRNDLPPTPVHFLVAPEKSEVTDSKTASMMLKKAKETVVKVTEKTKMSDMTHTKTTNEEVSSSSKK